MCIIAIKKPGQAMPDKETRHTMWLNNPNGAGFMFNGDDGLVHIRKGYMFYDEFERALAKETKLNNLKDKAVIMHFRITTSGGTRAANTHPFPVSDCVPALQALRVQTDVGIAHNGIIPIAPKPHISDTMTYISEVLAPEWAEMDAEWYRNPYIMSQVEREIQSKFAILNGNGEIFTIGDFVTDGTYEYSNGTYKGRRWITRSK